MTLGLPLLFILSSISGHPPAGAAETNISGHPPSGAPETNYFEIRVPQGRMVIQLYDETPIHRDNFRKLASEGFFDGTTFHRIIEGFMIQGGDPNSRDDDSANDGQGGPGYTLPAEIVSDHFHKKGALAAARQGDAVNPERRSSGSQFYLVHGSPLDSTTLSMIERQSQMSLGADFTFSAEARRIYQEQGGAPHLDGLYTVFGEIVEGMDVLDAIASMNTPRKSGRRVGPDRIDRPFESVKMTVRPLLEYNAEQ